MSRIFAIAIAIAIFISRLARSRLQENRSASIDAVLVCLSTVSRLHLLNLELGAKARF
jgi:hypothetical protein